MRLPGTHWLKHARWGAAIAGAVLALFRRPWLALAVVLAAALAKEAWDWAHGARDVLDSAGDVAFALGAAVLVVVAVGVMRA